MSRRCGDVMFLRASVNGQRRKLIAGSNDTGSFHLLLLLLSLFSELNTPFSAFDFIVIPPLFLSRFQGHACRRWLRHSSRSSDTRRSDPATCCLLLPCLAPASKGCRQSQHKVPVHDAKISSAGLRLSARNSWRPVSPGGVVLFLPLPPSSSSIKLVASICRTILF